GGGTEGRPGTTLSTSRCSASRATWSQWSPRPSSAGSSRSQRFSFLPTKDHFSSNCTSRVFGGKSHQLVVELAGVLTRQEAVADHRVLFHADEPSGLADADPLGDVLQDGDHLFLGKLRLEQRGAFSPPEAGR